MKTRTKFVTLTVVAAFLAQPILAAGVCWERGATSGACALPCPMEGEETPLPVAAKAQATDPECCEITATEPRPLTFSLVKLSASQLGVPPLVPLAVLSPEPDRPRAGVVLANLPPPETSSPLFLLHGVLLI